MQLQHGIIVTKLYPPVARSGLIPRGRLGSLLTPASLSKLVLKTALRSEIADLGEESLH